VNREQRRKLDRARVRAESHGSAGVVVALRSCPDCGGPLCPLCGTETSWCDGCGENHCETCGVYVLAEASSS
jgi:hypothetical protein